MDDLKERTVAIPDGAIIGKRIAAQYPGTHLLLKDSDLECIKAVSLGQADAYVGNLTVATHLITAHGLSNVRIAAPSPFEDHVLSYGIRNDWPELNGMIDKGLASLTLEEKVAIRGKYLSVRYEHGIRRADLVKWVAGIGAVALTMVLLFVFWNRALKHEVVERTAELSESEEKFRQLMEQSPFSIQIVNPDGHVEQANRAFMELWGIDEESLAEVLDSYNMLKDEECIRRGVMPLIEKAFQGESVMLPLMEYDAAATMDDMGRGNTAASKRWIQVRLYPLKNDKGDVVKVVDIEENITERKQGEEQLRLYHDRLRALAADLTLTEERERRRIAAELHDGAAQSLAFARIQLSSALKSCDDEAAVAKLDDLSQLLKESLQQIRQVLLDLSSPALNEIGLSAALSEWLEEHVGRRHGLRVAFDDQSGKVPLTDDVRAVLFRNARELLMNAVKYAKATHISVSMTASDDTLRLVVQDDGVGFDPETVSERPTGDGGFGLFSVRERMADMGGSFDIDSAPGNGCKATLVVPLGDVDSG